MTEPRDVSDAPELEVLPDESVTTADTDYSVTIEDTEHPGEAEHVGPEDDPEVQEQPITDPAT